MIHISMAKHVSGGYPKTPWRRRSPLKTSRWSIPATSPRSMGLTVLCAAYMAEHHASKREIVETVERMERFISSAFHHQQHPHDVPVRPDLEADPDPLRRAAAASGPHAAQEQDGGGRHGDGQLFPHGEKVCQADAPEYRGILTGVFYWYRMME